ncbi:hypothetical protein FJ872_19505 [Mesorhizobium sp. B2-5-9]|uniref:hypothetical protein n=1 Tax=Mesorhizobium sp. B2-5-9 TaxID=2589921 RepID=UPI00112D0F2A|nr:hypothetical protein [Mesorhizobium sp. B2-5-9]TPK15184.1 hypothetical protein FJ872_19505 [Mesorhizobium sp. B2-5-9]
MWKLDALSSLLCAATGVFVGLSLADATSFGNWLGQWQTLVAGALAVGAAAVTVFQMERTDIRQQARHIELVRLGLRSDRLTMLRLRDVWLDKLVAQADILTPALATIKEAKDAAGDYSPIALKWAMAIFDNSYWNFKEIIEKDTLFEEAKPLFDGEATTAARLAIQSVQAIRDISGPLVNFLSYGMGGSLYVDAEVHVQEYWNVVEEVPATMQRFAIEIRRIAALYE